MESPGSNLRDTGTPRDASTAVNGGHGNQVGHDNLQLNIFQRSDYEPGARPSQDKWAKIGAIAGVIGILIAAATLVPLVKDRGSPLPGQNRTIDRTVPPDPTPPDGSKTPQQDDGGTSPVQADSAVQWQGIFNLTSRGVDLDFPSPRAGADTFEVDLVYAPEVQAIDIGHDARVAGWNGLAVPGPQQCAQKVSIDGLRSSEGRFAVKPGSSYCVISGNQRVAFARARQVTAAGVDFDLVVWR